MSSVAITMPDTTAVTTADIAGNLRDFTKAAVTDGGLFLVNGSRQSERVDVTDSFARKFLAKGVLD
jgi:uncharacterized protein YfaP (DUF2135 family)